MAQATERDAEPAAFGTALRRLRAAQKTAKGVSLYSRYVNRPLGRVLAAVAYRAGLGPNQVTAASAAFSFAGVAAVALVRPSWTLGLCVYAALVVGFALDSADGQLARLRGGGSPAGEWLDHVVDCAKIVGLHSAVLISFHRFAELPGEGWLLLPLGFQLVAVLIFFAGLLTDKLRPTQEGRAPSGARGTARQAMDDLRSAAGGRGQAAAGGFGLSGEGCAPSGARGTARQATAEPRSATGGEGQGPSPLRALALLPVDYGVFCAVFLLLGAPGLFRAGYAALFGCYALFLAAFTVKWFRELSALPPG
ncbi:CDP-alcohol phosphatidyltransferase family protein [Streptomyces oryzae]|uniref:CDP-alcohol phosphatidyltransferase family protein n=1 Tax=Streptomyces oryzae TaxID=1434886 RepID=UPI001FFE22CD|nr:CDP-alcohol phosphatidyltransferase family protein [Streptomyces oryzae]